MVFCRPKQNAESENAAQNKKNGKSKTEKRDQIAVDGQCKPENKRILVFLHLVKLCLISHCIFMYNYQ